MDKFTQEEFDEMHKDFIVNFANKYFGMDLNFKEVCYMKGMSEEEFNRKINKNQDCPDLWKDEWVDGDENEYDSSSGGEEVDDPTGFWDN